jgi:hypothetical protein
MALQVILSLTDESGKVWADADSPLGLYRYQTFGPADFQEQAYHHWRLCVMEIAIFMRWTPDFITKAPTVMPQL